jgi:hypothetical protein
MHELKKQTLIHIKYRRLHETEVLIERQQHALIALLAEMYVFVPFLHGDDKHKKGKIENVERNTK